MKRLKCHIVEDHKSCRFEAVGHTDDEAKNKMEEHVTKKHKSSKHHLNVKKIIPSN